MQYILSQEEYDELQNRNKTLSKLPTVNELQAFCTLVANTMPVQDGWYKDRVWGCILTRKGEWYCDDCPAKDICPNQFKNWSK